MATTTKSIWSGNGGIKMGLFKFGKHGQNTGSPAQIVHDGDTVNVFPFLNFSTRFLGVDAPESSFTLPDDRNRFIKINDPAWQNFFRNNNWLNDNLSNKLKQHLKNRINPYANNVALNHALHEEKATRRLEQLIESDLLASGKSKEDFKFFMAFAYEILDSYGRLLCYISADEDNFTPQKRNPSYNELLLAEGLVTPYFIFPNVQPFITFRPFEAKNLMPDIFWKNIRDAKKLQDARKAIKNARTNKLGIFKTGEELILYPFELRFLGRGETQNRYVIDLSKDDGTYKKIIKPEKYFEIPLAEDRLFISEEFVPLFQKNGWSIS